MFYILLAFDMPFVNDAFKLKGKYKEENLI